MSITNIGGSSGHIAEPNGPKTHAVGAAHHRHGATRESGDAFAKLFDALSQTTLPTTGFGATPASAATLPAKLPNPPADAPK